MESAQPQRSPRGGLAGAMIRRQATGGRGRSRGDNCSPAALLLQSTGSLKKRLRVQLEGVPEMIADVRKSLSAGDHSGLFSAVIAIRTKLVEGTSAPFDLPVRRQGGAGGGGAGGGGGGGGGAEHNHGHSHGHVDDEDSPYNQNGYRMDQVRRLDREAFVALGGPDLLLEVLRGPGSPADARSIPAAIVARDMPVWNTSLVILRELCFTDQDLSERLGSPELILYLLTLMAHQGVFDLAVGLVEEILAVKSSTYYLGEVPELHSLVENMTSQQLAHFSRVLALLVFEPEYRQLMENAHVLRSMELLQLRRDRVVRANSIIDKNQALILSAPNLLPRLMELLRVMNFNPSLALFDEHAMELEEAAHGSLAQVRISLVTHNAEGGLSQQQPPPAAASDWGYLANLRSVAEAEPQSVGGTRAAGATAVLESLREESRAPPEGVQAPTSGRTRVVLDSSSSSRVSTSSDGEAESRGFMGFLRSIFGRVPATDTAAGLSRGTAAPAAGEGEAEAEADDDANGPRPSPEEVRAAAIAEEHGGAAGAGAGAGAGEHRPGAGVNLMGGPGDGGGDGPAGFAVRDLLSFLQPAFVGPDPAGSIASLEQALAWPMGGIGGLGMVGMGPGGAGGGGGMVRRRLQQPTAEQARQELQVNGVMLAPHQVEVLFVLCTLLGARRKGQAHQALANLGLIDVLDSMFDRLSWGVPAATQGPHGANCDCNPESALRVQYLRLVHNFLDRDSNNNPLKWLLLSPHERNLFSSGRFMPNPNGSGNVVFLPLGAPESETQLAFVWRGRATFSGDEEGDGEGDGDGEGEEGQGRRGAGGEGDREGRPWVDTRGLLSKIVDVFMKEPMDSLYRFWLASCVEAFLRGGSTQEQLFISGGGLLPHLVKEITSNGMWCAGSLQTAFDLLGELCKGNRRVLEMLEASMTEKQLRRFLQVMVDNLVDSNVFMRSLVLSVEHGSFRHEFGVPGDGGDKEDEEEEEETALQLEGVPGAAGGDSCGNQDSLEVSADDAGRHAQCEEGLGERGCDRVGSGGGDCSGGGDWLDHDYDEEPCYLGHTWFDVQPQQVPDGDDDDDEEEEEEEEEKQVCADTSEARGAAKLKDLVPTTGGRKGEGKEGLDGREGRATAAAATATASAASREAARARGAARRGGGASGDEAGGEPTRLQCFLKHNTPQLVRDLMCVVSLETINHENICCLNTAVLILIFADRRGQLAELLDAVRSLPAAKGASTEADIDSEFDLEGDEADGGRGGDGDGDGDEGGGDSLAWPSGHARSVRNSRARSTSNSGGRCHHAAPPLDGRDAYEAETDGAGAGAGVGPPQDGQTVLRNFRRLLWFWGEYYLRGGRDRLSLEFSTHVKFWAWKRVIRLLCADDGSPTALVDAPLHLPRSPYDTVRPASFPAAAAAAAASQQF